MSLLSENQTKDLNAAIISYLSLSGNVDPQLVDNLRDQLDCSAIDEFSGILERKWISVIRLQKRVMSLEEQVKQLESQIELTGIHSKSITDGSKWLPRSQRFRLQGHRGQVNSVAFHPQILQLASCSDDCTVKIWDYESGLIEQTLRGHSRSVIDIAYGSDPILLASCSSDLTIRLWDATTYNNIRTLRGHEHTVSSVRFLPDNKTLASASRDTTIKLWDVISGYCTRTIRAHSQWVKSISPSPDGSLLVSGGLDHLVTITTLSGETKAVLRGHSHVIEKVLFAPESSHAFLNKISGVAQANGSTGPVGSATGFVVSVSRDMTMKIWDIRGKLVATLVGHENWVRDLAFHPSGRYILSVADDKSIRCWDLAENPPKLVRTIPQAHDHFISSIKWAPNDYSQVDNPRIRCVVATGSVASDVKVWS
ncbi:hypothetical protein CANCADRAFT_147908 [Tortispora caseinolytica NRRL Y-17796]|uniref:Nuclear distribution protein PAC1 n=1 Tax=Tortispora caseinolytica NRRL Y-17796 TaxID=767744 RepID=A0A1E4TEQ2_9ASCO|nr:hypothetical protein CANCADRAFT_147908 [Tortispora caseinolytica NRRL Y-17796]